LGHTLGLAGFANANGGCRTILDPAVQAYEAEQGKVKTEQTIP
jgi:hypothetical protein